MSLTTKLVMFAGFIFFMLLMAAGYRKRKKKIIFFGDSITAQGALYGGFIQRITTYLQQEDIAHKYDLAGMGKGGDKVTDLQKRLSKDILERGADIVVLFIGVNDVWHRYSDIGGTDEQIFTKVYGEILDKLKTAFIEVILCTPAIIGENFLMPDEADVALERICDIIRGFAADRELSLVDLRRSFKDYLFENNFEDAQSGILTRDGVHLNDKGNELVAGEIWKTLHPLLVLNQLL